MAVRFRIQPYSGVTPIAQAFGNLANAFLSGPSQFEIDKLAAEGRYADVRTQDVQRGIDADLEASKIYGGTEPFSVESNRRMGAAFIRGGRKGDDVGNFARVFAHNAPGATVEQRDRAYSGAGGAYSGTETGFKIEDATRRRNADVSAGATLGAARIAQQGAMDRTTVAVLGPDGKPRYVTAAGARETGVMPVLDDSKLSVSPDGKGGFVYDVNRPGLSAPTPASERDRFVQSFNPATGRNEYQVPVPGLPGPVNDKDRFVVTPGASGPEYQPVRSGLPAMPPDAQSAVGKLMADRDRLPPGHPDRAKYDDAIAKTITASVSERNQKITTLVAQGLSPEDAAAITDKVKEIRVDQASGRVFLVDLRNPSDVKELPVKAAPTGLQPPAAAPAPTAPAAQPRAADTTGVLPTILDHISGTLGQVAPQTFGSPEITRNRQAMGIINELAVDALLKNSRASVAEQDRIRRLLPTPGVFTSPQELATRLEGLRDLTVRRMEMDLAVLNAQIPHSREARQQAEERYRKSEMLLREIDRFSSGGGQGSAPAGDQGSAPPAGALKEGVATTFGNGQTWTLQNGKPVRVR